MAPSLRHRFINSVYTLYIVLLIMNPFNKINVHNNNNNNNNKPISEWIFLKLYVFWTLHFNTII